jgi:crotonobetainyl-CoA:carnitine CoA-transferase CaiB-like acyl-CoA transferase
MADKDVAFAPVLDFREAFDQPHIAERRLLVEDEGRHHIAPAIRFAGDAEWRPGMIP